MMIILFYGTSPGSIKQRPAAGKSIRLKAHALAGENQFRAFTRK
jgi:hypothetical protein